MKFMLDTDTVSYWLRGDGRVVENLTAQRRSEVAISAIVASELHYGARRSASKRIRKVVEAFLEGIAIAPYGEDAARHFGRIAAALEKRGKPIGVADSMIAAHAVATSATLVTHNTKHFEGVSGLKLTDWY